MWKPKLVTFTEQNLCLPYCASIFVHEIFTPQFRSSSQCLTQTPVILFCKLEYERYFSRLIDIKCQGSLGAERLNVFVFLLSGMTTCLIIFIYALERAVGALMTTRVNKAY